MSTRFAELILICDRVRVREGEHAGRCGQVAGKPTRATLHIWFDGEPKSVYVGSGHAKCPNVHEVPVDHCERLAEE